VSCILKERSPAFFNVSAAVRRRCVGVIDKMSQGERAWRVVGGAVLIVSLVISGVLAFA
jgi:hypothetical protein